ncbi:MAG: hypothetical protein V1770_01540 [bacterium]
MSPTLITSRDPKGLHAVSLFEGAYNKSKLDDERAQRLNERGGEFKERMMTLIAELSVSNRYADEEVESGYGYLSGYKNPPKISDQIDILQGWWPSLKNVDPALRWYKATAEKLQLPDWVEGPFVYIRPGFFSNAYGDELKEVLDIFSKARDGAFVNYLEGKMGKELQQRERTVQKVSQLYERQGGGDIFIGFAQFGIRFPVRNGKHIVASARRAREKFDSGEYGVGSKDGFTMLLTNSSRLQHYDDLWIDFVGDEFDYGDGRFFGAPCVVCYCGRVDFGAGGVSSAIPGYGAASAFLPQ